MSGDVPKIVAAIGTASGSASVDGKAGVSITHKPDRRHPLDAALARVLRADRHLRDLIDRIALREADQVNAFGLHANPNQPKSIALDASPGIALPLDYCFGILVGEICYNLRASLDYLVYELAILNSGSAKRTQFPIERTASAFAARREPKNFLDGLSDAHVAAIETLQPYNGCSWTEKLRDISNPDKHRTLVGISGTHDVRVDVDGNKTTLQGRPGIIRSAITADGTELFLRFQLATVVSFADGSPVIEPLREIRKRAEETLINFKSDFS